VPALAGDLTTLRYGLKKRVGDRMTVRGADGTGVAVRIVGALPVRTGILQGALLVDEQAFGRLAPGDGYRLFLTGGDRAGEPRTQPGCVLESTSERLRRLGRVESVYLDMFLVLGGLGVVLGVAGMGLVVARDLVERRGELAMLRACGVDGAQVLRMLSAEYGLLVAAGLLAGVLPALAAVRPAAQALGQQEMPWGVMAGLVGAMAAAGGVSVLCGVRRAIRRMPAAVLGEEGG